MFVIFKGKKFVAFSPLCKPNTTCLSKTKFTAASDLTANTAGNGCQKTPDATKNIVMEAAAKRQRIGDGAKKKTYQLFQSNPSEKG